MNNTPVTIKVIDSEIYLSCDLERARNVLLDSLNKVGKLSSDQPESQFFTGKIYYGLNSIRVRISYYSRLPNETVAVVQVQTNDLWGIGKPSVAARYIETVKNSKNPGYSPDRVGMSYSVISAGILLIAFIAFVVAWLTASLT